MVGDTGTGKTYLMAKLLAMRKYVVMIQTKPDDNKFPGFEVVKLADEMDRWNANLLVLKPKLQRQAREVWVALKKVWEQGGWTVAVDEMWYAENRLGLRTEIENLLTQGRSKKITVLVGFQRPAYVSRFGIAESTHVFVFRTEGRDTKTIMDATSPNMKEAIEGLTGHDFAYFNRAKRIILTGNANRLTEIFAV